MEAVSTALVTGITSIATEMSGAIGDIIPVALPIAGMVLIVVVGLRVFKKIAK